MLTKIWPILALVLFACAKQQISLSEAKIRAALAVERYCGSERIDPCNAIAEDVRDDGDLWMLGYKLKSGTVTHELAVVVYKSGEVEIGRIIEKH